MSNSLLSILNDSNSTKNDSTNEIILKCPIIEIDEDLLIESDCKISSNCDTIIKCNRLYIKTSSVSFAGIKFQASIILKETKDFTITNCSIEIKSSYSAIKVKNCERITIKQLFITTAEGPGIYIKNSTTLNADKLTIKDTGSTMIVCFGQSNVSITNSTFQKSEANGLLTNDQSSIEILNSTFSDFESPALYLEKSKCTIESCKFSNIQQNAVSVHQMTESTIKKCEFTGIISTAISLLNESKGQILNNTFSNIGGNCVLSATSSSVFIRENKMSQCEYPAISITSNSNGIIEENAICDVRYSGIAVRKANSVKITKCDIKNIHESGISVSDTFLNSVSVCNNMISNCGAAAIESYNKSSVYAEGNKISNMSKYAFLAFTSGKIYAKMNEIFDVKIFMVKLAHKGGGTFIDNKINNCPNQCECKTSSSFFFNNNGHFKGVTNDKEKLTNSIVLDNSFIDDDDNFLCLKCNKNQRDCFLVTCGHKVYCKNCADLALKNKEDCPLCRFPIVDVSTAFGATNDNKCIICIDNPIDCIILPCGHMCACSKCLESWFKDQQTCPICRTENSFYKNI